MSYFAKNNELMVQKLLYNTRFPSILELTEIDSTNNYASLLIAEGMAVHGQAVFAHTQLAGKGQRGKTWHSEKNDSILMSTMVCTSRFTVQDQFLLIAITALAIRNVFDKYAQSDTQIKWPNDIYCMGKKAGGILIENSFSGSNWNWAIIGTGININQKQFAPEMNNAVSLKQITGKNWDTLALADEIRLAIVHNIDSYFNASKNEWMANYNQWLFKRNCAVTFLRNDTHFTAVVKEVTENGELIILRDTTEKIQFGDVSWIL